MRQPLVHATMIAAQGLVVLDAAAIVLGSETIKVLTHSPRHCLPLMPISVRIRHMLEAD
jgi:hypothetical protein